LTYYIGDFFENPKEISSFGKNLTKYEPLYFTFYLCYIQDRLLSAKKYTDSWPCFVVWAQMIYKVSGYTIFSDNAYNRYIICDNCGSSLNHKSLQLLTAGVQSCCALVFY
jgi:hypothetical protein